MKRNWPAIGLHFLPVIVMMVGRLSGADVAWLSEVQQVPERKSSFDVGTMTPLMIGENGTPVSNLAEWKVRRREILSAWDRFLGPQLIAPEGTGTTVLKTEQLDQVVRQLIRYECEPGQFVEAYLLKPSQLDVNVRYPGLVALHHTAENTIDEIAGVSGPESRRLGLKLAQRGFIVICPRCFLWQNAPSLTAAVEAFHARHPDSLGMRKMLFDAQRAVDILLGQPQVDGGRIGAVGHSLGAKEVLYLAAFDERIKASVASEGGIGLRSTNWDAPWYLGPQIRDASFMRNHHELLALVAPRAFLVLGGESGPGAADGERSWPLLEPVLPVYKFYGSPSRLGLLNHAQGHTIPDESFEKLAEWLRVYLSPSARVGVAEGPVENDDSP